MQTFPITQVHALRTAAAAACGEPVDAPVGWSVSRLDPMRLLPLFPAIGLRPGFVLRAYHLNFWLGEQGVVWALPIDAAFPAPDEGSEDPPPQPAGALDDVMAGIEGDGTPWSYLSASIFAREVKELGRCGMAAAGRPR